MAQLTPAPSAGRCPSEQRASCCEQEEYDGCCSPGASSCGCSAGETHRVRGHAGAAIIRARKPTAA